MTSYDEHTVSGLKQAIGRQANIRRSVEKTLDDMNKLFANAIGSMFEVGLGADIIEEAIWRYVKINEPVWNGNSEKLGILTHIGDYTNKKGVVSKAHFSMFGNYIKSAKAGDQPCSYTGNFLITKDKFDYDLYKKEEQWVISFEPK